VPERIAEEVEPIAGGTVTDRGLAIVFPISAFVATSFELRVVDMQRIPPGTRLKGRVASSAVPQALAADWAGLARNLIPVTLGNVVGGARLVAAAYVLVRRVALRER
jgi:formate/nitrite transporter FocA (FNT family)